MKMFLLGATGYIGGDLLYLLNKTHPEYEITVLVRDQDKAAIIAAEHPRVKIALGDNNSADVIAEEVAKADLIYHAANSADDVSSVQSISRALRKFSTDTSIHYIHTSGTGLLTHDAGPSQPRHGKIYNDITDIDDITSFPSAADHRNVDEIVLDLATAEPERIKTAIVCPAVIYGTGRGLVKRSSLAVPFIAADVLKRGAGIAPEGEWVWGNVHVEDLSRLTLSLIEIAATTNAASSTALWGKDAYYFVEAGESDWADIVRQVVHEAHEAGLIQSEEVKYLNKADAVEQGGPVFAYFFTNSRSRGSRARELLDWEPVQVGIEGTIREAVAAEASKLGML
ncbi:hypothetical protein D6D25_04378 [Aureobasidium pullulans]|nr:hypothetical protein D6D25_04378 [Aureobasidium pullulans]